MPDEFIGPYSLQWAQEGNELLHRISEFGENEDFPVGFVVDFLLRQPGDNSLFRVQFIQILQGETEGMNHGQRQQSVGFPSCPPLFFGPIQKGPGHRGALCLQEVRQNVDSAKVGNSPCSIVASDVALLDGSAGGELSLFDVPSADVLLRGKKSEPLQVVDFGLKMGFEGFEKGRQGFGKVESVQVDFHVDVVGRHQRFSSLGQIQIVDVEVSLNLGHGPGV